MTALLAGQAPLRERASTELAVGPFGFPDAARFTGVAVMPGSRSRCTRSAVACLVITSTCWEATSRLITQVFDAWMIRGPLNPTRPLLHEVRHLLDDGPRVRDKAVLLSVLADAAQRSSHEIDIVGLGIPGTARPVVLLGEVKRQNQPMGVDELDRLRRIRDLLDRQGKAAPDLRLLLVSAAGFTPELEVRQRAGDVLVVDPGDLLLP